MKRHNDAIEGCLLMPATFNDLNVMYEHNIQNRYEILKPDNYFNKSDLSNFEPIKCNIIYTSQIIRDKFILFKKNSLQNNTVECKYAFKLLLDEKQQLIVKCNEFAYESRTGKNILIKKPYIAIIFDEDPFPYFLCFDLFRSSKGSITTRCVTAFPTTSSYESLYFGLQQKKYDKFLFIFGNLISEKDGRKLLKAGAYYKTISTF